MERQKTFIATVFINELLNEICVVLVNESPSTVSYNPRYNGITERVNKQIIGLLRGSCKNPTSNISLCGFLEQHAAGYISEIRLFFGF